ncbi:hypothetical protein D3C78_1010170 [compost metagenome]
MLSSSFHNRKRGIKIGMLRVKAFILPRKRREPMPSKREQPFFVRYPVPGFLQGVFIFMNLKQTLLATQFIVNVRGIAQKLEAA